MVAYKDGRLYNAGINIPQSSKPPPGGDQRDHEQDLFRPRMKSPAASELPLFSRLQV